MCKVIETFVKYVITNNQSMFINVNIADDDTDKNG